MGQKPRGCHSVVKQLQLTLLGRLRLELESDLKGYEVHLSLMIMSL